MAGPPPDAPRLHRQRGVERDREQPDAAHDNEVGVAAREDERAKRAPEDEQQQAGADHEDRDGGRAVRAWLGRQQVLVGQPEHAEADDRHGQHDLQPDQLRHRRRTQDAREDRQRAGRQGGAARERKQRSGVVRALVEDDVGRREPVDQEQRGHRHERRPDQDGTCVAAARADTAQPQRRGGGNRRRQADGEEVEDIDAVRVLFRLAEEVDQPGGDEDGGRDRRGRQC